MKTRIILVLLCLLMNGVARASEVANKSLRVGRSDAPGPFSVCVATQAVNQLIASTNKYLRLLHSSPDLSQRPAMTATLAFLTEKVGDMKKAIYRVELTSLDSNLGWQLVQDSTGEIAPFSTLISGKAVLKAADSSLIGEVDLSSCSDQ